MMPLSGCENTGGPEEDGHIFSQPQPQHNVTQPQHSGWVGHENDFANPTPPHPTRPTHHRISIAASVSLRTIFIDDN